MKISTALRVPVLVISLLLLTAAVANTEPTGKKTVLIHIKDLPDSEKEQFYMIPQLTFKALERGNRVVIIFDARAAIAARIGHWYGGDTTKLDKMDIGKTERAALARDMGLSLASVPTNYGDFMRLLRGKGAELYVSHDAMRLLKIGDDEYDTAMVPIELEQMLEHFEAADVYISY